MSSKIQNAAKKWKAAMQSPATVQAYKDGINGTTVNPMQLAAAQLPTYLANVTAAVNSGRMANALNSANPATWKANASGPGAQNFATGVMKGSAKVDAFFTKFGPVYSAIKAQVASLPKGGQANAVARFLVSYTMLKQAAGKPV